MSESLASILVKASSEQTYTVKVALSSTVADMKKEVEKVSNIPAESQRLIYSGQVLRDDRTLESYCTNNMSTR